MENTKARGRAQWTLQRQREGTLDNTGRGRAQWMIQKQREGTVDNTEAERGHSGQYRGKGRAQWTIQKQREGTVDNSGVSKDSQDQPLWRSSGDHQQLYQQCSAMSS